MKVKQGTQAGGPSTEREWAAAEQIKPELETATDYDVVPKGYMADP